MLKSYAFYKSWICCDFCFFLFFLFLMSLNFTCEFEFCGLSDLKDPGVSIVCWRERPGCGFVTVSCLNHGNEIFLIALCALVSGFPTGEDIFSFFLFSSTILATTIYRTQYNYFIFSTWYVSLTFATFTKLQQKLA